MSHLDDRQLQCLAAMGIQVWERRPPTPRPAPEPAPARSAEPPEAAILPAEPPAPVGERRGAGERLRSARAALQVAKAAAAGEGAPPPARGISTPAAEPEPQVAPPPADALDWAGLGEKVAGCTRCPELVANRTRPVLGVGSRQANWMIIGEAPGREEERQGEPFVGRAGKLLNEMLRAIGLRREQVYIATVLKCRPPDDRDPRPDEMSHCAGWLQRQIELVDPALILVLGRVAARMLLQTDGPIGPLRGRVHRLEGRPLVVTHDPAHLLRVPAEKREAWSDLRLARQSVTRR